MSAPDHSRRQFLTAAVAVIPAVALIETARAQAPLPRLALDDPSAKALLYVEDHTRVDRKNPLASRYAPDQKCSNCSQIQGNASDAWRPCAIFPGKLVANNGWCSVWAKKT